MKRKHFIAIAKTFNQVINSHIRSGEVNEAVAVHDCATALYSPFVEINPNFDAARWRKALVEGIPTSDKYQQEFFENIA